MAEWSRALHELRGSILAQAASLLFLFKIFFQVFFVKHFLQGFSLLQRISRSLK